MDESMRERVARAICARYGDDYDEQPLDLQALKAQRAAEGTEVYSGDPGLPTQADWKDMARSAIEAMRFPTESMRKAIKIYLMDDAGNPVPDSDIVAFMDDLIEAALRD